MHYVALIMALTRLSKPDVAVRSPEILNAEPYKP